MIKVRLTIWLCFLSVTSILGCLDEPFRGNPLDSLSPDFENSGTLSGVVQNRALSGIDGATVVLSPGNISSATDANGMYIFDAVSTGSYDVIFSLDGYEPLEDTVTVSLGAKVEKTVQLNGLPFIENMSATTSHISRWWPQEDLFAIDVRANANDVDGLIDINSVRLNVPSIALVDTLNNGDAAGEFQTTLFEASLQGNTVQSMLGNELFLEVEDNEGAIASVGGLFLARVIDDVPVARSPQALETVSTNTPDISWAPMTLPFSFSQQIDVYRVDENVTTLVYSSTGISSTVTSSTVNVQLAPGEYFWTISVIDSFGNSSRSKQAGFVVP